MSAESLVLRERPARPWRLLLISVAFTVGGCLMIADGKGSGWFVALFFGLCTVVAAAGFLPRRATLTLTSEGFVQRAFGREWTESWDKIALFVIVPMPGGKRVGLNYASVDASRATAVARGAARGMTGVDAMFAGTFGTSAEDLAALLNDRLDSYQS